MIATIKNIHGPFRTVGIVIGVSAFIAGLVLHVLTYTRFIPPEKKKQLGIVAVLQMTFGAMMAMWPFMMDMAARSQE